MNITAVILTHYNSGDIKRTLRSVDFCTEILVIEDGDIREKRPKTVQEQVIFLKHDLRGNFAAQRNFGLEKAKNSWVLYVDDDEEVTPELRREIEAVLHVPPVQTAFYVRRRDFFWGRELRFGETRTARQKGFIRLVKKEYGKWKGRVHEEYVSTGEVGRLGSFINHYPHKTLTSFILSVNSYSTLRAEELWKNGKRASTSSLLLLPAGKFFYTYFIRLGFLDGPPGFVYSFLMSFHSFLVRAKLIQYEEIRGEK